MSTTKIEWTDAVWNPIRGCSKVSEGCRNCYAERINNRFAWCNGGKWDGTIEFVESKLDEPLHLRNPRRIFVNSMSDLFHENVKDEWLDRIFAVMASNNRHVFQILTKRPERMRSYLDGLLANSAVGDRWDAARRPIYRALLKRGEYRRAEYVGVMVAHDKPPFKNIWLGVSVENQEAADKRIPLLLQTPAAVRWVSAEPLLGGPNLAPWLKWWKRGGTCAVTERGLDWVVCGGESGPGARPMHPDWARGLRDQCKQAGAPFFFKGWGNHLPFGQEGASCGRCITDNGQAFYQCGKKRSGCLLDGREWKEFPEGR